MLAVRKLHLFVGVILSLILLCEGLTGFILSEPSYFGQNFPGGVRHGANQSGVQGEKRQPSTGEGAVKRSPPAAGGNNIVMLARTLHEGRIGTLNLRWLVSLSGLGLAILCITGLYMAIPHLRR